MLGILLLAHGGPGSVEDVPAFLEEVRGGRPFSEKLLDEVREKYRAIGGASPLPGITESTAEKLEQACGTPVYTGMLHWPPLLEDTVAQMVADGIQKALVICLVPHYSECGVGRYRRRTAAAAVPRGLDFTFVDQWHTLPAYVEGLADSIASSWKELGCDSGAQTYVIFSAHSLPKAAVPPGDPYEAQLRQTAELVAGRLGLPTGMWTVAYQSASGPGQEWLGPSVEELVLELPQRGISKAVVCPFGYLADQVEVLYDLDVVLKRDAAEQGVAVARAPLLNDGPGVIDSLALLAERWKG